MLRDALGMLVIPTGSTLKIMSATWNGQQMATINRRSILDAAEAALARCGAKATPVGLSAERVRALMKEQARLFANFEMPKGNPIRNTKKRVRDQNAKISKRMQDFLEKWNLLPEANRSLIDFCRVYGCSAKEASRTLNNLGIDPYPVAFHRQLQEAYKTKKMWEIAEQYNVGITLISRLLSERIEPAKPA